MAENKDISPKSPDSQSWMDSTMTQLAGAATAVGFTLATARHAISQAFHNSMNRGDDGTFKWLQGDRNRGINAISGKMLNNPTIRPQELLGTIKDPQIHAIVKDALAAESVDVMGKVKDINRIYDTSYRDFRKKLGIRNGFMGVFDEMKALKHHQWMEVAFATAAVASVAVGAIIAIASTRQTARLQEEELELERENTAQQGKGR